MTRILAVDDDKLIRRQVYDVLTSAGYDVAQADDGQIGLAELHRVKPDLVLVDFVMPKMNGFQFCAAVRAINAYKDLPIILLSSRSETVGESFISRFRVSDAVSKPFEKETLLAVVEKVLEAREKARNSQAPNPLGDALTQDEEDTIDPLRRAAREIAKLAFDALDKTNGKRRDAVEIIENKLGNARNKSGERLLDALERSTTDGALRGDIAVIQLADLLQMLAMLRVGGVLDIRSGGAAARIQLIAGQIAGATATGVRSEFLLGRYLVEADLLPRQDLDLLLGSRKGGKLLGEQLVKLGYISQEDLSRMLRRQTNDIMIELLRWREGRFAYDPEKSIPGTSQFEHRLDVSTLIMEGLRQVDEWRLIERDIPNFDVVFRLSSKRGAVIDTAELSTDETTVLDRIDGRRTVRELIDELGTGSFATCKMLWRLHSAKLIERVEDTNDR